MLTLIAKMLRRLTARLTGNRPVSEADRVSHYAATNKLQPVPVKSDRWTTDYR